MTEVRLEIRPASGFPPSPRSGLSISAGIFASPVGSPWVEDKGDSDDAWTCLEEEEGEEEEEEEEEGGAEVASKGVCEGALVVTFIPMLSREDGSDDVVEPEVGADGEVEGLRLADVEEARLEEGE